MCSVPYVFVDEVHFASGAAPASVALGGESAPPLDDDGGVAPPSGCDPSAGVPSLSGKLETAQPATTTIRDVMIPSFMGESSGTAR
jgi:hypothetical protein